MCSLTNSFIILPNSTRETSMKRREFLKNGIAGSTTAVLSGLPVEWTGSNVGALKLSTHRAMSSQLSALRTRGE